MAAIKRNTQIKTLVLKRGSKSDEEMYLVALAHKSKSFETAKAALLDLIEAIKEECPSLLDESEAYYEDCCKPYIKQRKKHCADCGNSIEGITLAKDDKTETIYTVDKYELEHWLEGATDPCDYFDDCGDWKMDHQLKCLTEPQNGDTVVVFSAQSVLYTLLENNPSEIAKLFKNPNSRVIEVPSEEDEDTNEDENNEEEEID